MNYWLLKSEINTYSIDDLKKEKITMWNGVRNYAARNNLKAMQIGDLCFFYHSVNNPAIVGLCEVVKEFYQDPTTIEKAWVVVDLAFRQKFKTALTLAQIKQYQELESIELIKY